jgi:hypothetical protein
MFGVGSIDCFFVDCDGTGATLFDVVSVLHPTNNADMIDAPKQSKCEVFMHESIAFSCICFERYAQSMSVPTQTIIANLCMSCLLLACAPTNNLGNAISDQQIAQLVSVDSWPFHPRSVVIHPLSYIPKIRPDAKASSPRVVEIYVECLDLNKQSTRTPGFISLSVQDPQSKNINHIDVDLSNLENNKNYWDTVTKTYRFTIPLPVGFECANDRFLLVRVDLNVDANLELKASSEVYCSHHSP